MNSESSSHGHVPSDGSSPVNVLILDDEPTITELLGEMLEMLGYITRQCHTPEQALTALTEQSFDVVLSDFRMPQMNGRQFYSEAIRCRPQLAGKVVFLTGDNLNEELLEFLQSSGCHHLGKPFQLARVTEVISALTRAPLMAAA